MPLLSNPRFLAIYSGILTLIFAATVVAGYLMLRHPTFGIITCPPHQHHRTRRHRPPHHLQPRRLPRRLESQKGIPAPRSSGRRRNAFHE